jgi:hypothetical protein
LPLLERAYWRLAARYLREGRSPLPCAALQASAYVDPDLVLYPCATWDRPLARLRDHGYSLERALATAAAQDARAAAQARACPNCFTPCEAYPTMLARPFATLAACLAGPARETADLGGANAAGTGPPP